MKEIFLKKNVIKKYKKNLKPQKEEEKVKNLIIKSD